jgi:protein SMG7
LDRSLRKRYLTLLLVHPYAKESKDVENHLWMQTSYAFISSYKERLAVIDRAIQATIRQPQGEQQQQPRPRPTHGPVEHRKLLARFRQFLAEEEKFWVQLLLRMYRTFGLEEAQPALTALGLVQDEDTGHFAFPDEPAQSLVPTTPAARESRLAILSKALICLGDIARYRELYNEAGGRPRAGQESGRPARRGRNRRGGAPVDAAPQPRLYDNAQQRYDQARWLVPQEGNPFHQLAILATYRKDGFASVYCYYRALCVRQPYETAAENLATVLQKALDQWKRSRKDRDRMLATGTFDIKDRVQLFKERVVVLHAIWRKGIDRYGFPFPYPIAAC